MLLLKLLGGAVLQRRDGSAVLIQRRPLAVLAVLANAGERGINRERLAALFWPESADEQAKGATRQVLHVIRKGLASPEIVLGTVDLRLNTRLIRSDLAELEIAAIAGEAKRVEQHYAGPFLDGFALSGSEQFNKWADRERDRIVGLVRDTYERRAAELSQTGENAEAVRWWRRIQALDPLDARAALSLMRALAAAGDPMAAVRHARLHATLVRTELDLDPDPAINELAEFLRGTGSLAAIDSATVVGVGHPRARVAESTVLESTPDDRPVEQATHRSVYDKSRSSSFVRRTRIIGLLALALIAAGVWRSSPASRQAASSLMRPQSPALIRIAVLPLDVESDTADEYLAEGVVDAIRSQLASDLRLEVIGRASSNAYQHSEKSVDSIAAELRATYVATGRLGRSDSSIGASLDLEFELRQPQSGGRVFSKLLAVPVSELGTASDSLAKLVASHLGTNSTPSLVTARSNSANSRARAYDLFLRGEMLTDYDGTWEAARLQRAIPYFAEAVREDSLFVPAWAAMARADAALFNLGPSLSISSAAHRALLRSQTLAPTWPGSLLAASVVAHIVDSDNHLALAAAKGGLAYAPHDADLLIAAADGERSFGRWQAAFSLYHEAVNIDPRSSRASMKLIQWYIWQRDYRKALAEANRALGFAPKNLDLRLHKVMAQVDMGDLAAARITISEAPSDVDRARMAGFFADFWDMGWVLDDSLKTVLLYAKISQRDSTDWSGLANLAMMRGDTVQARAFALRMVKFDAAEVAEFPNSAQGLVNLCFDLAFAGESDNAIRACQKAIVEERRFGGAFQEGARLCYLARVATIGGRNDVAIAALDTALSIPSNVSRDAIRINPNFASLRTNAKFRALIGNH